MKLRLLLVSVQDFPEHLVSLFQANNFEAEEARGCLRIRELFKGQEYDAIVWYYAGHEKTLALDLVECLAQGKSTPIVLITQSYEPLSFKGSLRNLQAHKDLNDEPSEILQAVERACNQNRLQSNSTAVAKTARVPEIDFLNKFGKASSQEKTDKEPVLKLETPWVAVDRAEKQILSQPIKRKKGFFSFFGGGNS